MRVRFTASPGLGEYHSIDGAQPLSFHDGEEKEISADKAFQVIQDFPANFAAVVPEPGIAAETRAVEVPPVHKMVAEPPLAKRTFGRGSRR